MSNHTRGLRFGPDLSSTEDDPRYWIRGWCPKSEQVADNVPACNVQLLAQADRMYQFIADYLWSKHNECPMTREACCQSDEQLGDIAREILEDIER